MPWTTRAVTIVAYPTANAVASDPAPKTSNATVTAARTSRRGVHRVPKTSTTSTDIVAEETATPTSSPPAPSAAANTAVSGAVNPKAMPATATIAWNRAGVRPGAGGSVRRGLSCGGIRHPFARGVAMRAGGVRAS